MGNIKYSKNQDGVYRIKSANHRFWDQSENQMPSANKTSRKNQNEKFED